VRPYADAVSYFGRVDADGARAHFDGGGCTIAYPKIGVKLAYFYTDPLQRRGTPESCTIFHEAAVTSAGWHTNNGLAIGATTKRIRELFPHAYDTGRRGSLFTSPKGSIEWDLTVTTSSAEQPALAAMVEHDRVVALTVTIVGH
jgi:hypothetical protein